MCAIRTVFHKKNDNFIITNVLQKSTYIESIIFKSNKHLQFNLAKNKTNKLKKKKNKTENPPEYISARVAKFIRLGLNCFLRKGWLLGGAQPRQMALLRGATCGAPTRRGGGDSSRLKFVPCAPPRARGVVGGGADSCYFNHGTRAPSAGLSLSRMYRNV